jgi:hypothetical protein
VMHDVARSTYVELADQPRGSVPRLTYDERESAKRLSSKTFGSESSSCKM